MFRSTTIVRELVLHLAKVTLMLKHSVTLRRYIYLSINQLGALNFVMSLFHASTCFEHYVLIARWSKLYYAAYGIITPVGGRPVHRLREDCARDGHLQV